MVSIKIDDNLFAHATYSTDFQESKYIKWNRSPISGKENIAVYTDNSLSRVNPNVNKKICWLLESPSVSLYSHEWIAKNHNKFDIIFTNNKTLLDINDKFKFVPTGGCWIKSEDQYVYPKSKLVSIIASNKNWTDGHILRQKIVDEIKRNKIKVDLYGRGFNEIKYKLDGLKDYMFSIVVENTKKDYYFTEKIIDCFVTGTIPIYWGCPSIGNYFDEKGVLVFNNIDELNKIVNGLSPELYNLKLEYARINFEKAKEYMIAEDYMYEKYNNIL